MNYLWQCKKEKVTSTSMKIHSMADGFSKESIWRTAFPRWSLRCSSPPPKPLALASPQSHPQHKLCSSTPFSLQFQVFCGQCTQRDRWGGPVAPAEKQEGTTLWTFPAKGFFGPSTPFGNSEKCPFAEDFPDFLLPVGLVSLHHPIFWNS